MDNYFNKGNVVGIIGGGQLGRMMILEGKKLGIKFIILDPDKNCPASHLADQHIVGGYYDQEKIKELVDLCQVTTYELEHIDSNILMDLVTKGYNIQPSPTSLHLIQNKYVQKTFLKNKKIPIADFKKINSIDDIKDYISLNGLPILLKGCLGGYDGKGNQVIKSLGEIESAYEMLGGSTRELMVEEYIQFAKEVSVICIKGVDNQIKVYPLVENIHVDNILRRTIAPAMVSEDVRRKAEVLGTEVIGELDGFGVFCIEMFVDNDGSLLVNEIAPRVHNSGHYTMEGCNVSQFNQHLRGILGYPLLDGYLVKPTVMINLLGDKKEGSTVVNGLNNVLKEDGVYVYLYGKEKSTYLRKMGHVTLVGNNIQEALAKADIVERSLVVSGE